MRAAFRTDADAVIGGGHLMRCLALADLLRERGAETLFVTRAAEQPWRALLRGNGHAVVALPVDASDAANDAKETRVALTGVSPDWLVVDHYALGKAWETALRPGCGRIFAIDDIGRPHDCDLLLDQNALGDEQAYRDLVPAGCRRLLGPRHALLRPDFGALRGHHKERGGVVQRLLINFGGSDPTREIEKSIAAFLAAPLDQSVRADVIVGPANPRAAAIRQEYDGHPRLNLISHTDRMADAMAGADLAIGAGGVSMWERACLGLPSIAVITADNQMRGAEWLAAQGGHLLLGDSRSVTAQDIAQALVCLAGNAPLRNLFARIGAALVDGRGCERVVRSLLGNKLVLRPVTVADCDAVYAWRNAEVNRRYSGDERPIAIETHRQWFAGMLADPARIMLIATNEVGPIGVLRFDLEGTEAVVSIYLVPNRHGMGWGEALLDSGAAWLRAQRPAIASVRARIKSANHASLAAFKRAGYVEQEHIFILSLHNTP